MNTVVTERSLTCWYEELYSFKTTPTVLRNINTCTIFPRAQDREAAKVILMAVWAHSEGTSMETTGEKKCQFMMMITAEELLLWWWRIPFGEGLRPVTKMLRTTAAARKHVAMPVLLSTGHRPSNLPWWGVNTMPSVEKTLAFTEENSSMLLSLAAISESPEWAGKASFRHQDLDDICKIMVRSDSIWKFNLSYWSWHQLIVYSCMLVCNIWLKDTLPVVNYQDRFTIKSSQ